MFVVLVDTNIEGHAARIWQRLQAPQWQGMTSSLGIQFLTFREIGLDEATPDKIVWRLCQENTYYLLTSNRNEESDDSLEATIRREGSEASLPVLTLPLPDRVFHSPSFLERVVNKLFDFALYAANINGAGRVFLP